MRGSRNFRQGGGGGGPGQSDKKPLTTFFLVLSLFYSRKWLIIIFKVPEGVQHFPGGPTFSGVGGSNCLFL